ITPYNVVFGQLSHSDTNIVDILGNNNYDYNHETNNTSFESNSFENRDLLESELDLHYFLEENSKDKLDPNYFIAEDNVYYSSEKGFYNSEFANRVSLEITVISYNSESEVEVVYEKRKSNANLIELQLRLPLQVITNSSQPSFEKHEKIRQVAILNVKKNREFIRSDLVKIQIPNIDKIKMDRKSLPCKVIQKRNQDFYQIACKFRVLDRWYPASELIPLGTPDYPDLDIILLNETISLRHAAIKQNHTRLTQSLNYSNQPSR
ncbi:176_t:CDS:2, partial [Cetraspora pellucida]